MPVCIRHFFRAVGAVLAIGAVAWLPHAASGQVIAPVTGSISVNLLAINNPDGSVTYGYIDAFSNLNIAGAVVPVTAAAAGSLTDWSSATSWDPINLNLDQSAVTVTNYVSGTLLNQNLVSIAPASGDISPFLASGPDQQYLPVSIPLTSSTVAVTASVNAGVNLQFAVTIPSAAQVMMDPANVTVQSLSVLQGGILTGDGNFTVTGNLSNAGALGEVGGLVQGNLTNTGSPLLQSGGGMDVTSPLTVQGTFSNTGSISIETGGSLNFLQPAANGGTLNLNGGAISLPGALTNNGTLNWYAGTMDGVVNVGTVTIPEQSALALNWLNNSSGGLVDVQANGTLTGNTYASINNAGTFRKSAGDATYTISNIDFTNRNTIEVDSGVLELQTASVLTPAAHYDFHNMGGSFVFANGSTLLLDGGDAAYFDGTAAGTGNGVLDLQNVNVSPASTSTISPTLNFTGSTSVIFDGGSITTNAGGVGMSNSGNFQWNNGSITGMTNSGTIIVPAEATPTVGSLNNLAPGVVDVQGDGVTFTGGQITNAGLLKKSDGTGISTLSGVTLNNSGTVEVDSGVLELSGFGGGPGNVPAVNSTAGTFLFTNGGEIQAVNANMTFAGLNTGSGLGFLQASGSTLQAAAGQSATLNFGAGNLVISDDSFLGGGITNAGTMQISPVNSPAYVVGPVVNTGTIQHTQGTVGFFDSGSFNNQSVYQISGGATIDGVQSGAPAFVNSGMLQKIGTGTALIGEGVQLQNTGTIEVDDGTLIIGGLDGDPDHIATAISTGGNFVFTNGGELQLANAVMNLSGTIAGSGSGVLDFSTEFTPNTIQAVSGQSATLNFAPGNLIVTDDTIIGPGITNSGTMQISPSSSPVLVFTGSTFTNTGTIAHTQGILGIYGGANLVNRGLYQLSGDASIHVADGGIPVFTNTGTFQVTGSGVEEIGPSVQFQNSGPFQLTGGTMQVFGTYTGLPGGTLTISPGAELDLENVFSQTAALTNNGTISVSGTATTNAISGAGALVVQIGARLTLSPGGGVTSVGSLSLNGTGVLDIGDNTVVVNYGVGNPSPVSAIAGDLLTGRNGGAWNGLGIVSSTVSSVNAARSDPNLYTIGYADSADAAVSSQHFAPGTVVIKPVLVGDANLDGIVNFSDFQLLASGFNGINTTWDQGDFNYAKKTNFTDFQLLASNFNNSKSLDSAEFDVMNQFSLNNGYRMTPNSDGVGFTLTAVPEPASMALIAVFGLLGLQRRRGPRICCK